MPALSWPVIDFLVHPRVDDGSDESRVVSADEGDVGVAAITELGAAVAHLLLCAGERDSERKAQRSHEA